MFFTLFLGAFVLCLTSCNKSDIVLEEVTVEQEAITTTALGYVDIDLTVRNGRLVFNDISHMYSVMEKLSSSKEYYYTREALDEWEFRLGFKSERRAYEELMDEYDLIETDEQRLKFQRTHRKKLVFDDDKGLPKPLVDGLFSYVIDENGTFYEKDALHHLTPEGMQIVVLDGDESKLPNVISSLESQPEQYVHVFNTIEDDAAESQVGTRAACDEDKSKSCDFSKYTGSTPWRYKKVSSIFRIRTLAGGAFSNINPNWYMYAAYEGIIYSERKKRSNHSWKKNHYDDIEFGTGFGIIGHYKTGPPPYEPFTQNICWNNGNASNEVCGGTGWVQNSWKIDFFINYSSQINTGTGNCDWLDARFLYNINFVRNNDLSGLECDDSCYTRGC